MTARTKLCTLQVQEVAGSLKNSSIILFCFHFFSGTECFFFFFCLLLFIGIPVAQDRKSSQVTLDQVSNGQERKIKYCLLSCTDVKVKELCFGLQNFRFCSSMTFMMKKSYSSTLLLALYLWWCGLFESVFQRDSYCKRAPSLFFSKLTSFFS